MTSLLSMGAPVQHMHLKPMSALYVPMGWFVVEKAVAGQVVDWVRMGTAHKNESGVVDARAAARFFYPEDMRDKIEAILKLCED